MVAFEPSSRERRSLQHNVTRNRLGNVTIVPSAVGSLEGTAALQIASGVHSGHNTLGALVYDDAPAVGIEHVPVERLDVVMDRLAIAKIDVIKIDVEGAEMHVLERRAPGRSPRTARCSWSKPTTMRCARRVRAPTR